MKLVSKIVLAVLLAMLVPLVNFCQPTQASETLNAEICEVDERFEINELTNSIVDREIDLQRRNASFKLAAIKQPKMRVWRQFIYTETNASCTLAANIARMTQSYPLMATPPMIRSVNQKTKQVTFKQAKAPSASKYAVSNAAAVSMIGQLFSATGESYELSSNIFRYLQARHRKTDSSSYRKNIKQLAEEIDQLLADRRAAIEDATQLSAHELEIARAETEVLQDVRDLSLNQYVQYHSEAKKMFVVQNGTYVGSITKNVLGASGNMMNIKSSMQSNTRLGVGAAFMSLAAGVATIATPIASRVSGSIVEKIDRRIVSKDIGKTNDTTIAKLNADRERLQNLQSDPQCLASEFASEETVRGQIYRSEEELLQADRESSDREHSQQKGRTVDLVAIGTVQGSTRIAQGITGMVGGLEYPKQSWIRNRFTAGGSTAYAAGTALNLLDTARSRVASEMNTRKLRQAHLLPSQVLNERLAVLNRIAKSKNMLASSSTRQVPLGGL